MFCLQALGYYHSGEQEALVSVSQVHASIFTVFLVENNEDEWTKTKVYTKTRWRR